MDQDTVLTTDEKMQNYPSPSADHQDSTTYYNHDGGSQEPQHHDVSAGQHQASHAASVEELQLAAQLGQDLAAEPLATVTDPSMKFDEPNLRNILPHSEDSNLRNSIPQPHAGGSSTRNAISGHEESVPRPFITNDTAHTLTLAPQIHVPSHHALVASFAHTGDGNTPPRKRSKVSRACDECRRKKVRCDAQPDSGDSPCSNCRRSSQLCSFSRIPQKRGPSKGYIKELADRIHSIEGRLGESTGSQDDNRAKRAYSGISSLDETPPVSARQHAVDLSTEVSPTGAAMEHQDARFSTNGLAPEPLALKPDISPRPAVSAPSHGTTDMPDLTQPRDIDEEVFQSYLSIIHPLLPVLPESKARLQVYLAQCSSMLREAFLEALAGTVAAYSSFVSLVPGDVGLAKKMLAEWETNDEAQRTHASHIVHLQTLSLLIIEADARPAMASGTQKESLLGRAVGVAWALRLYHARIEPPLDGADIDSDAEDRIRVRLWWCLILLDRWNAVATGIPNMIRKESAVVFEGLETVMGDKALLLIRLSKILERVSAVVSSFREPFSATSVEDRIIGEFLDDSVENFREDLPPHVDSVTYPVIHSAYWHCRLLSYLLHPSVLTRDLLWPCRESVGLLAALPGFKSPFHHHFLALITLVLIELSKLDKVKEDAILLLAEIRKLASPSIAWEGVISERIADHLQSVGDQHLLQQLADVAASSSAVQEEISSTYRTASNYESVGFDPRTFLTPGYLKHLWSSQVRA